MNTLWKYSYFVYLIIAIILVVEAILKLGTDTKMAAIIFAIAVAVLFKFFLTRKYRKKIQERNQQ